MTSAPSARPSAGLGAGRGGGRTCQTGAGPRRKGPASSRRVPRAANEHYPGQLRKQMPGVSFNDYLDAQQRNLEQIRRLPHFTELVLPIHELYTRAVPLIPPSATVYFGRLLLLSHRNFMSAATLVLRGLPDDAAAVPRRALEAARVALAIKYDPENLKRWLAGEERMARWGQRQQGKKPKDDLPKLKYPAQNPLCEALGKVIGMLSDAAVHFTPEFLGQQSWHLLDAGDLPAIRLNYFIEDQRAIERGLSGLAAWHCLCLDAFDACYDGTFSGDSVWSAARRRVQANGRMFAPRPGPEEGEGDS